MQKAKDQRGAAGFGCQGDSVVGLEVCQCGVDAQVAAFGFAAEFRQERGVAIDRQSRQSEFG